MLSRAISAAQFNSYSHFRRRSMKLAILGADRQTLGDRSRHRRRSPAINWSACAEIGAGPMPPTSLALRLPGGVVDNWESLLDAILARRRRRRLRRRRRSPGRATAQICPGRRSRRWSPIRCSSRCSSITSSTWFAAKPARSCLPYLPDRLHPAIGELAGRLGCGRGSIGRLEQVSLERHLVDRGPAAVKAQFARDADLLSAVLAGDLTHLGAMAGGGTDLVRKPQRADVGPQRRAGPLVGRAGRSRRLRAGWWSSPRVAGRCMTHAGRGGPWQMEFETGARAGRAAVARRLGSGRAHALEQLRAAIAGQAVRPDWLDAARSIELAETIDRSLARGRTIELHHEEYNEAGSFKSLMAASGCGLLLAGLLLLVRDRRGRGPGPGHQARCAVGQLAVRCCWHCWRSFCCCNSCCWRCAATAQRRSNAPAIRRRFPPSAGSPFVLRKVC